MDPNRRNGSELRHNFTNTYQYKKVWKYVIDDCVKNNSTSVYEDVAACDSPLAMHIYEFLQAWCECVMEDPINIGKYAEILKECCMKSDILFQLCNAAFEIIVKTIREECVQNIALDIAILETAIQVLKKPFEHYKLAAKDDNMHLLIQASESLEDRVKKECKYKELWWSIAQGSTLVELPENDDFIYSAFAESVKGFNEWSDQKSRKNLFVTFLKWEESVKLTDKIKSALQILLMDHIASEIEEEVRMRVLLGLEVNAMEQKYSMEMARFNIGDLKELKHLGEGGQAKAKLVQSDFYPEKLVLKLFQNKKNQAKTLDIDSLMKEVRCLALGNHPHIVNIFGVVFEYETIPIGIVLEYCDSGSLDDAITDSNKGKYAYGNDQIINWTLQAASALIFLHKKNTVHRDIKPANMLLKHERTVLKIADLAMSKLNASESECGQLSAYGTDLYAAPELEKNIFTPKCDVHSLGISLWQMIHKKSPTAKNRKKEWKDAQLFKNILDKMTETFEKRFTAEEVYRQLKELQDKDQGEVAMALKNLNLKH